MSTVIRTKSVIFPGKYYGTLIDSGDQFVIQVNKDSGLIFFLEQKVKITLVKLFQESDLSWELINQETNPEYASERAVLDDKQDIKFYFPRSEKIFYIEIVPTGSPFTRNFSGRTSKIVTGVLKDPTDLNPTGDSGSGGGFHTFSIVLFIFAIIVLLWILGNIVTSVVLI